MAADAQNAAQAMIDQQLVPRGIRDPRVLNAMQRVPREQFIPEVDIATAYADCALPTRNGQTISQPYIVARMTELLDVQPGQHVLEIGGGTGYQAAILHALGAHVIAIERDEQLVQRARQTLASLDLNETPGSIQCIVADGTRGCPEHAPFHRILITAAAPEMPVPLAQQLTDPARVVLPIGDRAQQHLTVIDRRGDQWTYTQDIPCRFVPLIGEYGFTENNPDAD